MSDLVKQSTFFRANDMRDQLTRGYHKGKAQGETTHIRALDDNLTIRHGFLYCYTGWPGSGKSEFIANLAILQAIKEGRKTAFYSPENYPIEDFIDDLIHSYLGESPDTNNKRHCDEASYLQALQFVDEHFIFVDFEHTPGIDELVEVFTYLRKKEKFSIFVIDPFNSVMDEGENIAMNLKKSLTSIKRFTYQTKAITWLVEHPKTPTDPKEYDQVPNNRNLFGGTMWWNKSDVGVSIHRADRYDKQNKDVYIDVWKVKKQHYNGCPGRVTLIYEYAMRQFHPKLPVHTPLIESPFKTKT